MIWSISWRNVWRSPMRSTVVIIAITLGMFAGVFSMAFFKGMMDQRLELAINTEVSHIQIHQPSFRDVYDLSMYIKDADNIISTVTPLKNVTGISERLIVQSMIASSETGSGVMVLGVYPEKEETVTNLYTKMIDGQYFEGIKKNPVIIGEKLADKLKVNVRSKVVITFQDAKGNITAGAFRVAGIFKTPNSAFDETNVFVRYTDIRRLTELEPGSAHEIVIALNNPKEAGETAKNLQRTFPELEVQDWKNIMPELAYLTELGDAYMYIFILIILLALGFGIVNTMLMAVLERVRELGMLMAIGMNKPRIFKMVMLESIFLTLTGGIIGIMLGVGIMLLTQKNGIDLSMFSSGLAAYGYDTLVYPMLTPGMLFNIIMLVIFTGMIAAIYPAYKALKYNPAEAIRTI